MTFIFQLWASDLEEAKLKFNLRVINSKSNSMFYEAELRIRKNNFYKNFRDSNSKNLFFITRFRNSILLLENSELWKL